MNLLDPVWLEQHRRLSSAAYAAALQRRVAEAGFDWPDVPSICAKVREEAAELEEAVRHTPETVAEELGDLLFVLAHCAQSLKLNPDQVLQAACEKFVRRYQALEAWLTAQGITELPVPLELLEQGWQVVKAEEASITQSAPAF
jgi:ATP diphosphatase